MEEIEALLPQLEDDLAATRTENQVLRVTYFSSKLGNSLDSSSSTQKIMRRLLLFELG
jgi:hypothetical protein